MKSHAAGLAIVVLTMFAGCQQRPGGAGAAGSRTGTQTAGELVAAIEQTLQDLPSYSCQLKTSIDIGSTNTSQKIDAEYDVAVEKPLKWAIKQTSGMLGATSVSDGEEMTFFVPMVSTYFTTPTPPNGGELVVGELSPQLLLIGPAMFPPAFLGRGVKDLITEGATASTLDEKTIGGQKFAHAKFTKDGGTWEVWATHDAEPLLRRIVIKPDFSKIAAAADNAAIKNMSIVVQLDFTNWKREPKLATDAFAFTPPESARRVESLLDALRGGPPPPHQTVGERAEDFELQTLDGHTFKLTDVLGKKVIMLDFWATWCSPCIQALPGVIAAAEELGDDVVFYAVNQGEDAETVLNFFRDEDMEFPVLLDESGSVGNLYGVSGIPHTLMIGKDGRVQVVHVGFGGDAREELAKQLTALVSGEDLATKTLDEFKESGGTRPSADGADVAEGDDESKVDDSALAELWSKPGAFTSVAVDPAAGMVYALSAGGNLSRFKPDGNLDSEIKTDTTGRTLQLAQLDEDPAPELLAFSPWGGDLEAFDDAGDSLWTYPGELGIDDVAAADLDDDGLDEVIVGYNGAAGLHVVDHDGKERWKTTAIGNVWHVTAGTFSEADAMQVVSTSAAGKIHVFAADGAPVKEFDVGTYANGVRFVPTADGESGRVFVTGMDQTAVSMSLVDGAGEVIWKAPLPSGQSPLVASQEVDAKGAYAIAGLMGGLVHVVDLADGKIVASLDRQGDMPTVALLAQDDGSTLAFVATHAKLATFKLNPSNGGDEPDSAPAAEVELSR